MNTILRSALIRNYFLTLTLSQMQCLLVYRCATLKPKKYKAKSSPIVQKGSMESIEQRSIEVAKASFDKE